MGRCIATGVDGQGTAGEGIENAVAHVAAVQGQCVVRGMITVLCLISVNGDHDGSV